MATLSGKSILMIIAKNEFRDEEYEIPRKTLEKEGAKITVACSSTNPARGMLGLTVKPDMLLSQVDTKNYDAVIFVGGQGSTEYWNDSTAHKIARQFHDEEKITSALCLAPVTLLNAGLLKDKKATVWQSEGATLRKGGAHYTGSRVEVDGRIITADGPTSAQQFAEAVVKGLSRA